MDYDCLGASKLERFLERRRANPSFGLEMSLSDNLIEVLRRANEFVPSKAGSILLDDPIERAESRSSKRNSLTFIAAFGESSEALIGRQIPVTTGIAGHVYLSGRSHTTPNAQEDWHFYPVLDQAVGYETHSLVAIPVSIGDEVCGVLELVNRIGSDDFSPQDLNLLEIFAGYISISIQNVIDGRQAQEIAKRDNLTGLYNDRYLHLALSQIITSCREAGSDLSLLFLDLDYFKHVNDHHGHLAGSQVLRDVGELIAGLAKDVDALVARYGGDEFVLAIPNMHLDDAIDFAERIRLEIGRGTFCSQHSDIQQDPLFLTGITGSIGVASLNRHTSPAVPIERCKSTLLRLADAAMYVAKETGRNRTAVAGEPIRRRDVPD